MDSGCNMILSQPPLWILFSQYIVDFQIDEIQIGYIMNDDAISYLEDVRNLYDAYKPFIVANRPKLEFPLTKMKKRDILNQLPEFIVKNISYCELYDEKNCKCESCKKHRDELNCSNHYHLAHDNIKCEKMDYVTDSEVKVKKPIEVQLELEFSKN